VTDDDDDDDDRVPLSVSFEAELLYVCCLKCGLQRFRGQDVRETVTTSIFKISCHYFDRCCIILGRLFSIWFRLSEETWELL